MLLYLDQALLSKKQLIYVATVNPTSIKGVNIRLCCWDSLFKTCPAVPIHSSLPQSYPKLSKVLAGTGFWEQCFACAQLVYANNVTYCNVWPQEPLQKRPRDHRCVFFPARVYKQSLHVILGLYANDGLHFLLHPSAKPRHHAKTIYDKLT
eukprot:3032875-Amphidinium_carterae.1